MWTQGFMVRSERKQNLTCIYLSMLHIRQHRSKKTSYNLNTLSTYNSEQQNLTNKNNDMVIKKKEKEKISILE